MAQSARQRAEERWDARSGDLALAEVVGKSLGELKLEISDLRRELESVRAETPKYRGIWQDGVVYAGGDMVTKAGGLWIAKGPTTETPGNGKTSWQLAVKAGTFDDRNQR
jgi:hypothetical protein